MSFETLTPIATTIGGGSFIISSILWGMMIDKKKPDRYEIIGDMVAVQKEQL